MPSNSATDELAARLVHPRGPLAPRELLRVNGYSRSRADMPQALLPCAEALWDGAEGAFKLPSRAQISGRGVWVVAATCVTAQKMAHAWGDACAGVFSHVAVDEAGQATEPECLCAVTRLLRREAGRLVLAGDPRQVRWAPHLG